MLKAKVLGKVVEINDQGSLYAEDKKAFEAIIDNVSNKVVTSQGLVFAGTGSLLESIVLLNLVDNDFELVSGSDEAKLVKRLVQEGDVLED